MPYLGGAAYCDRAAVEPIIDPARAAAGPCCGNGRGDFAGAARRERSSTAGRAKSKPKTESMRPKSPKKHRHEADATPAATQQRRGLVGTATRRPSSYDFRLIENSRSRAWNRVNSRAV
jgi:hypothetical protein